MASTTDYILLKRNAYGNACVCNYLSTNKVPCCFKVMKDCTHRQPAGSGSWIKKLVDKAYKETYRKSDTFTKWPQAIAKKCDDEQYNQWLASKAFPDDASSRNACRRCACRYASTKHDIQSLAIEEIDKNRCLTESGYPGCKKTQKKWGPFVVQEKWKCKDKDKYVHGEVHC